LFSLIHLTLLKITCVPVLQIYYFTDVVVKPVQISFISPFQDFKNIGASPPPVATGSGTISMITSSGGAIYIN